MVIKEKDFQMTQISQSSCFWDLEVLKTIKPKGGEERQEFVNVGYGMTLSNCIRRIVNYRIATRHTEEFLTMKEYLKEYIAEIKEIRKYIEEALGEVENKEIEE